MAGLADDWPDNQQTCVDVLCAYLRMPYEPEPSQVTPGPERLAFRANREARHTVIRVIAAHLQADVAVSWQVLDFDFTGVVFDGGDFTRAVFSDGPVSFRGAEFAGGTVDFHYAVFSGGTVDFGNAVFSGGTARFDGAVFSGGTVDFHYAVFSGGTVSFGGNISFDGIVKLPSSVGDGVEFSGGTVYGAGFAGAKFSGGTVDFYDAKFSGGTVDFDHVEFSGGTVDFSRARDWSFPPAFPWTDTPPPSVKLPEKKGQSRA